MEQFVERRARDEELYRHQMEEELRLQSIETKLKTITDKVDTLSTDVSSLVATWNAASWLISFIKWVGGIATAITALLYLVKGK